MFFEMVLTAVACPERVANPLASKGPLLATVSPDLTLKCLRKSVVVGVHPGSPLVPQRQSGGGKQGNQADHQNDGDHQGCDDRKAVHDRSSVAAIAAIGRTKAHFMATHVTLENPDRHDYPLFDHTCRPDLTPCLMSDSLANSAAKYRQNDEVGRNR